MKKLLLALTLFAGGLAATAQTAEEIVAKHIEAMGGKEAWAKVSSVRYEASITVQGTEVSINRTILQGKGMRMDVAVMGMNGYEIMTPAAGWAFRPYMQQTEKQASTPDEVKEAQGDLETSGNGLIFYKERGHAIELAGKESIDGTECFNIRLTMNNGAVSHLYIDPKTWYIVRETRKSKANGQEKDETTGYANYKKQPEGVVMPFSVMIEFGEIVISKMELNKPVDEKIFKPE